MLDSWGHRPSSLWAAAIDWLPRGGGLEGSAWTARHRGICVVLWGHVAVLPLIGVLRGETLLHSLAEASLVVVLATGALVDSFGPLLRSWLATLGLLTTSAVLVHLFDGLIEMHFHFFVMVAVIALYQAWQPFVLALAFVMLHHSIGGTLVPGEVYNHPAAADNPWLWGLLHGGFVLAESVACLVYWRASEEAVRRERDARLESQEAHRELARAQELSGVGSWEWDVSANSVTWSDQLYALAGADRDSFAPSVDSFLQLVHPEDRARVGDLIQTAHQTGGDLDYECRLVRPDGTVRVIHALGESVTDEHGAVLQMRGTCHDVTERKQLQDVITHLAFHDPLTGLPNRRLLLDRLETALLHLRRRNGRAALLFIDLDGFKEINDSFGHAAGDTLIQEVAARLSNAVGDTGTIARWGGDEFALLCEGADFAGAQEAAERIEQGLQLPMVIEGRPVTLTASVGIAVADPDTSAGALLHRADAAMYAVKTLRRQDDGWARSRQAVL